MPSFHLNLAIVLIGVISGFWTLPAPCNKNNLSIPEWARDAKRVQVQRSLDKLDDFDIGTRPFLRKIALRNCQIAQFRAVSEHLLE